MLILAAAFGLWYVVNGWVVKPYRIPSASMEPTLTAGDRVLVSRFVYHLHDPRRGDIVVFHPPGDGDIARAGADHPASVYFIKRVIGLPGETVQSVAGRVQVCQAPGVDCRTLQGAVPGEAAVDRDVRADTGAGRLLLHDGRQPRRLRRQPRLGRASP